MVRLSLLLVLVSGLMAGCVSNSASLRPAAQTQANTAPKVHRVATRVLTPQFGKNADKLPAIDVRITNGGSEPIEFSPAQITAFADDKPIKVYGLADYQQLVEGEIKVDYVAAETSEQSALIRAQWNNNKPGTTSILQAKAEAATKRMESCSVAWSRCCNRARSRPARPSAARSASKASRCYPPSAFDCASSLAPKRTRSTSR